MLHLEEENDLVLLLSSCSFFLHVDIFAGGTTSRLGGGFQLDYIISTMENQVLMYPLTGSYGYV